MTGGGAVGALCAFARNIVVARLISVEDFGIASTFAITMALVEMSAGLGVDRLIVQAADGNNPKLQATIQGFNVVRGALVGLILFAIAGPIADLFGLPEVTWAFQWLAVLPVVRGFVHMDPSRVQREMKFLPSVLTETGPQLLTVAIAAPLALYLKDYRVMLWLVGIQAVSMVLISNLVATRPYRWAWSKDLILRIISFGWPLMLNGFLLFGIFQADRTIVGIAYNMEDLGWFSAAFTLTLFPSMLLAKICQAFFMPNLAKVQDDVKSFQEGSVATVKACMLLGMLLTIGLTVAGPALLLLFFGEKYIEATFIVGWLALMQGIRTTKAGPVIVAISKGDTKLPLYSNIVRSSALAFALYSIWQGWGILGIVLSGIAGETLAVIWIMFLLKRRFSLNLSLIYIYALMSTAIIAPVMVYSVQNVTGLAPVSEITLSVVVGLCALGIALLFSKDLLKWLKR